VNAAIELVVIWGFVVEDDPSVARERGFAKEPACAKGLLLLGSIVSARSVARVDETQRRQLDEMLLSNRLFAAVEGRVQRMKWELLRRESVVWQRKQRQAGWVLGRRECYYWGTLPAGRLH
jgi:hypothetical protein